MKMLLCAATELEIAPTLFWLEQAGRHPVTVLVTGVGMLSATYALTRSININRPDFIVQAGIGGGLRTEMGLGDVVAIRQETVGDLGVEESGGFRPVFALNLPGVNSWPWQDGWLRNDSPQLQTAGVPVVDAVTVNEITTAKQRIRHYRDTLGVAVESMEGAALHFVALQEKIPFLQLRSLSNFIGERDKDKWRLKDSIFNLNRELQRLLKTFA